MSDRVVRSLSGLSLDELTLQAVQAGKLVVGDFRISGETLLRQADAAEQAGYRQVAENLRRAAELTRLPNQELLDIYDALRPGRATHQRLSELAERLEQEHGAPLTAALVREAADVYLVRGLVSRT